MCADSINYSKIDFSEYLINNDHWLREDGEIKNAEGGDGKLSNREISIFFTNTQIDFASPSESILEDKEFQEWYKANESAISAYFNDKGIDYNDEKAMSSMYFSMQNFILNNSDSIDMNYGKDLPANEDDIGAGNENNPVVDNDSPQESANLEKLLEPPANFNDFQKSCYESYTNMVVLNEDTPSRVEINGLMNSIVNNDNGLTTDEKFELFRRMSDINETYIKEYFKSNDTLYINALHEIIEEGNFTTHDIIGLNTKYKYITGKKEFNSINADDVITVYEKAKEEGKLPGLLKSGFYSYENAADLIQSNYKFSTETRYLQKLFNVIYDEKSSEDTSYRLTEEEAENLKNSYFQEDSLGALMRKESMEKVLYAYENGKLEKNDTKYLLKNIFKDGANLFNMSFLISEFRDLSDKDQENYLKALIEIFD